MRFATSLVTLSLAVPGLASFYIGPELSTVVNFSQSDLASSASAAHESINKEFSDALTSYQAEITKAPEWASAMAILSAYQLTGDDVPAAVTATDDYVEYTTTPDWFKAMPTDAKNYFASIFAKEGEIYESAVAKLERGAAPATSGRPAMILCGAAVAAFVGAVGVL